MSVSGQLPTYPSPNPILTLNCYQLTVVELGEGKVDSCSDTDIDPNILLFYLNDPSLSPYLQNNNKQFVYTVWHLFFSSRIFLDWTLLIKNFHYYITGTYQSEATWNILKHSLPIKCTAWSILLPIKNIQLLLWLLFHFATNCLSFLTISTYVQSLRTAQMYPMVSIDGGS